ncbi:MAG TPA: hypothetical protein VGE93_26110, partial [Bryobacteraceae bacterium]
MILAFTACGHRPLPNQEMIDLLKVSAKADHNRENVFSPEAMVEYCDSLLGQNPNEEAAREALSRKANALLQLGEEQKAIDIFQQILDKTPLGLIDQRQRVMKDLAISYLRLGDRMNCINNHTAGSCIFPIAGDGVHRDKTGAEKAIALYKTILTDNPGDLESRWLLNIAYMTAGGYPSEVPPQFLLKVKDDDSAHLVKPFRNVAMNIGLNY